jgi:multimeric flavodoxin WrbA
MKVFGILAGRKLGNCEILAKEAFMAAAEIGAEVEMVNLHDVRIIPCNGCETCTMRVTQGKSPDCVHKGKDDMDLVMDRFLKADGILLSVPTFVLQPAGIYKIFIDRWLPYEIAFLLEAKIIQTPPRRVAALITAGGSTQSWMSLTLAGLQMSMFMQSIKVVDQMMASRVARPGQVLLKPDLIARARKVGANLAKAMKMPYDQVHWLGDPGWCPVCHSNVMIQGQPQWDGKRYDIECGMCGAGGALVNENGSSRFVVAENGLEKCRIYSEGRQNHFYEIQQTHGEAFKNKDKIKELNEKYRTYTVPAITSEGK